MEKGERDEWERKKGGAREKRTVAQAEEDRTGVVRCVDEMKAE